MREGTKPKIALFDYSVTASNPIGGCNRRMLEHLADEFDYTVFAVKFENPHPDKIKFVRIPVFGRPLFLLFICFHVMAPIRYYLHRLVHRERFDLIQKCESNLLLGEVSYTQFCHRFFLRKHWKTSRPRGVRRYLRWLDHLLHAMVEPIVYRRARRIVVASKGLGRELIEQYPYVKDKVNLIYNPVDLRRMEKPDDFDRDLFRQGLGYDPSDTVLIFAALGQFERKGLPHVLEALTWCDDPRLKLLVVGGTADLVADYQRRVENLRLSERVVFVGMTSDVTPYLWSSDAFVFPTSYEVFALASLEAAGAGLPLIVTSVNGIEEFIDDGGNGILIERSDEGVAKGLARFAALTQDERLELGIQARHDVGQYSVSRFVDSWRDFYETQLQSTFVKAKPDDAVLQRADQRPQKPAGVVS